MEDWWVFRKGKSKFFLLILFCPFVPIKFSSCVCRVKKQEMNLTPVSCFLICLPLSSAGTIMGVYLSLHVRRSCWFLVMSVLRRGMYVVFQSRALTDCLGLNSSSAIYWLINLGLVTLLH